MESDSKTQDKIEQEVERRLKEKLSELEPGIREQVKEELEKDLAESIPPVKEEKPDGQITELASEETFEKEKPAGGELFVRFGVNFRFQHISLLVSTIMLILTGVPLKFPKNGASQFIIEWFGGPAGARSIHHFFALCLILIGIYHLVYSFWSKQGRKDFYELLPSLKDFSDLYNQLKYYLGFKKEKVKYGRFSYVEKFDYWAVYWGLIMMIGTGMVMWLFQGKFSPVLIGEIELSFGPDMITNSVHAIAREMHSDEALLATLVIIGWHFYNVHLNPHKFPMSKVWLNGKVSKEDMISEHPLEYDEIMRQRKEQEAAKADEKI